MIVDNDDIVGDNDDNSDNGYDSGSRVTLEDNYSKF